MKTNWTFALAVIALILGSTPVEAGTTVRTVRLPSGQSITVTGTQRGKQTHVVVTGYNPNGPVYRSQSRSRIAR